MRRAVKAGIILVTVVVVCVAARLALLRSTRQSATITLPGAAGTVTFVRQEQDLFPFIDVAFDRKIIYQRAGRPARSWKLPVDAGYNMWIDVYWISEGEKSFLRFIDREYEYLLDLRSNELHLIATIWGGRYAGLIDNADTSITASQRTTDKGQEAIVVKIGKNPAVPLNTLVLEAQGTYLGRVWGPASSGSPGADANGTLAERPLESSGPTAQLSTPNQLVVGARTPGNQEDVGTPSAADFVALSMDLNSGDLKRERSILNGPPPYVILESELSQEVRRLGIPIPEERQWRTIGRAPSGGMDIMYVYGHLPAAARRLLAALDEVKATDEQRRDILERFMASLRTERAPDAISKADALITEICDRHGR